VIRRLTSEKMNVKTLLTTIALLPILGLAGCSSGRIATVSTSEGQMTETHLVSNNALLASRVAIANIATKETAGLLRTDVALRNRWKFELDFEYKFKFYDKDGFEIDPDGRPWKKIVLRGGEIEHVQATAPNSSAKSFQIYIQD